MLCQLGTAEVDRHERAAAMWAARRRALFAGDREFGQWVTEVCSANLAVHDHERAAAMWAAANADQQPRASIA